MCFSNRLKEIMSESGVNNSKLSRDTGISSGLISEWVRGEKLPGYEKLRALALYFSVSGDRLLSLDSADSQAVKRSALPRISDAGREMLALFEQLPERDQQRFIGRLEERVETLKKEKAASPADNDKRAV